MSSYAFTKQHTQFIEAWEKKRLEEDYTSDFLECFLSKFLLTQGFVKKKSTYKKANRAKETGAEKTARLEAQRAFALSMNDEKAEGWVNVNEATGQSCFLDLKFMEYGDTPYPYMLNWNNAIELAGEVGCEAILKTKYGYSLRQITIPVNNPVSKPENLCAFVVKGEDYLMHSRTTLAKNKREAKQQHEMNAHIKKMFITQIHKSVKPEPEPKPEQSTLEVVEVVEEERKEEPKKKKRMHIVKPKEK